MKTAKNTTKFEVRFPVEGNLSMRHSLEDDKQTAIAIAEKLNAENGQVYYVLRIDKRVVHISRKKI